MIALSVPRARSGLHAPPVLPKHIFSNLFFEYFFNVFFDAFGSDLGTLLGSFWSQNSMFFFIKKCIDFLVPFLTPLGWILGPSTLQN